MVVRRILQLVPTLLIISVFIFFIIRLVPGDPATLLAGDYATPEMVDAIKRKMGLDKPAPTQYVIWLSHAVRGDLGNSFINHVPVVELIKLRLPATIHLTIAAFFVTLLISVPGGILAATYQGSRIDVAFSAFTAFGLTVPVFWLGLLLLLLFALHLRWLPPSGFVNFLDDPVQSLRHLILPAITLGIGGAAVQGRFIRTSVLEVIAEDYVRTAYAKGLRQRAVVLRHVLRNAAIPVVTMMGLQIGALLAGTVLTETIFVLPGVGRLTVQAVLTKDYTVVQGAVLFIVMIFVIVNLLVDLTYSILDPRVRKGEREGT